MKWSLLAVALAAVVAGVVGAVVLGLGRGDASAPNHITPTVPSEVVPFTQTVADAGGSDDASDNANATENENENENEHGSDNENENDNGD